ncbi:sodium-dependent transporter [Gracilinema caldarium]|uniref:Transporter n=1 Tax=Gracilinema caldarium (strain ATCC 51460 / DSM 7334 / H1) TaxID=744872 RepID=F8F144_GRAC1|nr:sodium-dependent transporter [Gracilinema caldarium]AEJ20834.1 sodium:neurotransmitter symporter [Gracilinema caldarium DSM 7334]
MEKQRDGFVSSVGAFTATVASAVGLGNIWKFPYLAGVNGGAAFVLTYLLAVALVGLPILVAEHAIGRKMRKDAVGSYAAVVPQEGFWVVIGYAGIVAAFFIMAFYSDVAGWVFSYIYKSLVAALTGTGPLDGKAFESMVRGSGEPLLWQIGVLIFVSFIVVAGVSKGIERATKLTMPVLLGLLLLCDIRALTLPGAFKGVEFLFAPDFSKLSGAVILSALGLAFFKLSLGMGTMTTYGSYMPHSVRIVPNATRVALADTLVSLLAGLAIFPAVFAFGFEPASGPSLLFISIPAVFSKMPLGTLFTVLFFLLSALAATGAMISLIEVPVAWLSGKMNVKRSAAVLITALGILVLGVPATLSLGPWAQVKLFNMVIFDLLDYIQQNLLLPLGGLAIAIVAGWRVVASDLIQELEIAEKGKKCYIYAVYGFIKYISPALIVLVFLNGFGIFSK